MNSSEIGVAFIKTWDSCCLKADLDPVMDHGGVERPRRHAWPAMAV
jgi:hypothetical protein